MTRMLRSCSLLLLGVLAVGCNRPNAAAPVATTGVVRDSAFASIGAVFHDGISDAYFVSQTNGGPLDEDGNGFISLLDGDGRMVSPRYIDAAAAGVAMHAPKGLATIDTILYVADLGTLWMFHRDTGQPLGSVRIAGATALHAVVAHPSLALYLTDAGFRQGADGPEPSGTDAVYRLWPDGRLDTLAMGPALGHPTGLAVQGDSVWVVGATTGELYRLDGGQRVDVQRVADRLEGLVVTETGIFVTDPLNGLILRGRPGGEFQVAVRDLPGPRALGFDRWRFHLLVVTDQGTEFRRIPLAF